MDLSKDKALELIEKVKNSNYLLAKSFDGYLETAKKAVDYVNGDDYQGLDLLISTKGNPEVESFAITIKNGKWVADDASMGGLCVDGESLDELIKNLCDKSKESENEDLHLEEFIPYDEKVTQVSKYVVFKQVGFNEMATCLELTKEAKRQVTTGNDSDKVSGVLALTRNLMATHETCLSKDLAGALDSTLRNLLYLD